MRGKVFILLFILSLVNGRAQSVDLVERYKEFQKQVKEDYDDFRMQMNLKYIEFMGKAWKLYKSYPPIPRPQEKDIEPIEFERKDRLDNKKSGKAKRGDDDYDLRDDNKIAVKHDEKLTPFIKEGQGIDDEDKELKFDELITVPVIDSQPKPVVPIKEKEHDGEKISFLFYKLRCDVRLNPRLKFKLKGVNERDVMECWKTLTSMKYDNAIRDCLLLRAQYNLCDWAYLLMLEELSHTFLGENTNEATLLMAYLFSQSGYKIRLAIDSGRLRLLFASEHLIFDNSYFVIGDEKFYTYKYKPEMTYVCEASYPSEKPLSLFFKDGMILGKDLSENRVLQSRAFPELCVNINTNKELIDFYGGYPNSKLGENPVSRWAIYASAPMNKDTKAQLYPQLIHTISGKSILEKVNMLLNFVQTAFVYRYDDEVWGGDRAFFAEESLYYPYCDCEDRSILFSRLVRDLLGLKVILVYYPGHLATAVHFTEEIKGDYIILDDRKYVVCDPTYLGAFVGETMSGMDNSTAKVILLE
ncbi:MAG: hypothetical protein IJY95_04115 [Bacteroides sp.]|nr:hypothetical protein [Bacteroides sp.]